MNFVGLVTSRPDASGVDRGAWIALIDELDALTPVPARIGTNPFTGEPIQCFARLDCARVVRDGTEVGSMSWSEDEANQLVVMAVETDADYVESVACEIADQLGAKFVTASELKERR